MLQQRLRWTASLYSSTVFLMSPLGSGPPFFFTVCLTADPDSLCEHVGRGSGTSLSSHPDCSAQSNSGFKEQFVCQAEKNAFHRSAAHSFHPHTLDWITDRRKVGKTTATSRCPYKLGTVWRWMFTWFWAIWSYLKAAVWSCAVCESRIFQRVMSKE